jgi:4-hydroxy-tetrahydrodipicolinate reductase
MELVAGVSRSDPDSYSSVAEALDAVRADVLVDFTHASAVKANVFSALGGGVNVVIGSSGLSASDYDSIDATARDRGVGVISAGNFSLTAAILLRAATEAARHLEAWEILDFASAGKPDAPSGTAQELAERLGDVRSPTIGVPVDEIVGARDARGATVAGSQVHSVRLPSFVVSTEIVFAAEGERLTIRHDARGDALAICRRDVARDPFSRRAHRPDSRSRPTPRMSTTQPAAARRHPRAVDARLHPHA